MTSLDIAGAVARATRGVLDNDGATVSAVAGALDPSVGYVVANGRHERTTDIAARGVGETVADYAHEHAAALAQTGAYLGAWIDDGYLVLDIVSVLPERNVALNRARDLGERAIFNLATGETLWTADYFPRGALNASAPRLTDSHNV